MTRKPFCLTNPIEMPIGNNAGIIRQKLGQIHVGSDYSECCREIRRACAVKWTDLPRALRRGVILYVIDVHRQHRQTYCRVMFGVL